jgi:hypothetical protein
MTCCNDSTHPNSFHCKLHSLFGECSYSLSVPSGLGGTPVSTPSGTGGGGNTHGNVLPEAIAEALQVLWEDPSLERMRELTIALGNDGWYNYALGAAKYVRMESGTVEEYAEAIQLEADLTKQIAGAYSASFENTLTTLKTLPPEYSSEVWKQLRASESGNMTVDPIQIEDILVGVPGNNSILAVDVASSWNTQVSLGRLLFAPSDAP